MRLKSQTTSQNWLLWLLTMDVTGLGDRLGLEEDLVQRVGTRLTLAVTVEPQAGFTPTASQHVVQWSSAGLLYFPQCFHNFGLLVGWLVRKPRTRRTKCSSSGAGRPGPAGRRVAW